MSLRLKRKVPLNGLPVHMADLVPFWEPPFLFSIDGLWEEGGDDRTLEEEE